MATPPKPRKRKRKKATIETGSATKAEQQRRAVFRGFLRYVERHGVALREVWDGERIEDDDTAPYIRDAISWSAFQKAATNGQWRIRREEHWREVKRKVLDHAQTEAVQAEIAEIGQLEAVRALVLDRITGNAAAGIAPTMPKSLEGAVGAFVQLDKRIASKRDTVVEQTAAAAASAVTTRTGAALPGGAMPAITVDDNPLTDEEIAEMSRALAAHRAGLLEEGDNSEEALPSILKAEE
jgi:hypothetical protein